MNLIETCTSRVLAGGVLTREEASALSLHPAREALYEGARRITRRLMGNKFDTCSIINAKSGNCPEDCKWCAQSGHYSAAVRLYPLLPEEECVRQALACRAQGVRRLALVTSGKRLSDKELAGVCSRVRAIRRATDIRCCASLGLLTREQLQLLYASGVENYHCNMETAPSYFGRLCTTHTQEEKTTTLRYAREAGFRICSGGIIGMGETMEQRIELAFFLRELDVRSVPLNLLQPIPGTPLEQVRRLPEEEFLVTVALFRYILPQAYLRFSGGRALLPKAVQRKALQIGVNAAITGDLLTTTGSRATDDRLLFTEAGYSLTENTDWKQ